MASQRALSQTAVRSFALALAACLADSLLMGPVEQATRAYLNELPVDLATAALGASALALAQELDSDNSATSKSMCAKAHLEILDRLRELIPPEQKKDDLDDLSARRAARLAGRAAASN